MNNLVSGSLIPGGMRHNISVDGNGQLILLCPKTDFRSTYKLALTDFSNGAPTCIHCLRIKVEEIYEV